jgi:hypothetical protein
MGLSRKANIMGFDQYHEPPEELSKETRTSARMITSLIEEAEAISWYELFSEQERDIGHPEEPEIRRREISNLRSQELQAS